MFVDVDSGRVFCWKFHCRFSWVKLSRSMLTCIHSEVMISFSILKTCFLDFIKALSHWCIFHRSKAELVVTTWEKQFHNAQMVQKVPLLYLANDILQNSKRKGNEFVTEFWKVLPGALKVINEEGDDHGKNVVSRLVSPCFILLE